MLFIAIVVGIVMLVAYASESSGCRGIVVKDFMGLPKCVEFTAEPQP